MGPLVVLILMAANTSAQRMVPRNFSIEPKRDSNMSTPTGMPVTGNKIFDSHVTLPKETSGHMEIFYVDCITVQWIPDLKYSNPLHTFYAVGVYPCWRYCNALFRCAVLTYDMLFGVCSLFSYNFEPQIQNLSEYVARTTYTYVKSCVESSMGTQIPSAGADDIISLSENGTGFLIEQYFAAQRTCLSVKNKKGNVDKNEIDSDLSDELASTQENAGYNLTWKPCEAADRWMVQELKTDLAYQTEDTPKLFHFSPTSQPDLCIDIRLHVGYLGNMTIAALKKCREFNSSAPDLNTQAMFLLSEELMTELFSIFSLHRDDSMMPGDYAIIFTEPELTYAKSLYGLFFRDPSYYNEEFSFCPLSQFSIPHGNFSNKYEIPFLLPGREVDVWCEPGYEVQGLEDTSVQSVICEEDSKPAPCKKKRKKQLQKKMKDNPVLLVVTVVSLVFVVVLAVALIKTRCIGRGGEEKGGADFELNGLSGLERNGANDFTKDIGPV